VLAAAAVAGEKAARAFGEALAALFCGVEDGEGERSLFVETDGGANGEADGVGVGTLLAYSWAAATRDSRIALSVASERTKATESTFSRIASAKPNIKMIS